MAMHTVSTKRKRVYPRKFDHEKAIEMYEKGFTYSEIVRHLGNTVTPTAIARVVNPRTKERMQITTSRWLMSGECSSCGAPRTHRAVRRDDYADSGLCRKCWGASIQKRFTFDENGEVVLVHCPKCDEWKPRDLFAKSKNDSRGIYPRCRPCSSADRQAYRERHKEPCITCGEPALPPREKGRASSEVVRCRKCFYEHQRLVRKLKLR